MHERNGVLDELSEKSKKCTILRLVYARGLLSPSLNGSSNCLVSAHKFLISTIH